MDQVLDFFRKLFDTSDWPPRWHCGKWTEFHGWFYIISDLLIWSAYFAIPLVILKYITRRVDSKFVRAYFLFAAFILACGSTHLLDAITFWFPAYRLNALVRFITGVVSWITVFHVVKILPVALKLKSHEQLEKEIRDREIAEEKLKVSNTYLNEAQEIAKMGHWQWDFKTNKVEWSDGLYKVYNLSRNDGDLTFEKIMSYVHLEDRSTVDDILQKAIEEKKFPSYNYRIQFSDGHIKHMQANGEILLNSQGEIDKIIGIAQDVSEQFHSKQQLMEKTTELEASNVELQRFAYVASHDLQEPLRKIQTFASLLEKDTGKDLSVKSRQYLDKIYQSSNRMQKLIEDILRFSNLRADKLAFEQVDLNQVVQQVLSDMEVVIQEKKAVIMVPQLSALEAIPSQIGQLFQNLIGNALKFQQPGIIPEIVITSDTVSGLEVFESEAAYRDTYPMAKYKDWTNVPFVKITLKDNGVGFDEIFQEKIFEIFQRLHSNYEGTGIGLAICKKVVDNHHGFIKVSSQENVGTVFTIILPVSQNQ
jgi:PAS domain S-box-containing protein